MAKTRPLRADEANKACEHLQHRFISLQKASEARKDILQQNCEAFQVYLHFTYVLSSFNSAVIFSFYFCSFFYLLLQLNLHIFLQFFVSFTLYFHLFLQ